MGDAGARVLGDSFNLELGFCAGGIGDVDGDGTVDLAAAGATWTSANGGSVYVFTGPLEGNLVASDATSTISLPRTPS